MCNNNNIIPNLLGYSNDQVHSIETEYKEESLDKSGMKINILIDGKCPSNSFHFVSKERISELISNNRKNSLSIIDDDDDNNVKIKKPKWKVGDMCYFDFKIHYISGMNDNKITSCLEDYGGTDSYDLSDRCFKITPHTMRCSKLALFYYSWISEKEHLIPVEYIINIPNIFETMVKMWIDIIHKKCSRTKLSNFGIDIINAIDNKNFDLKYISENEDGDYEIFRDRLTTYPIQT